MKYLGKEVSEAYLEMHTVNNTLENMHRRTDYVGKLRLEKAMEALGVAMFIISEFNFINNEKKEVTK